MRTRLPAYRHADMLTMSVVKMPPLTLMLARLIHATPMQRAAAITRASAIICCASDERVRRRRVSATPMPHALYVTRDAAIDVRCATPRHAVTLPPRYAAALPAAIRAFRAL